MRIVWAACWISLAPALVVAAEDAPELRLPGLEQFEYGGFSELQDTVTACLVAAARQHGDAVTYGELRGLSGMAFRLLYQWPWTPAAPEPREGFDCTAVAAAALGLELTWVEVPLGDAAALAAARQRAVTVLRSGWPVLLYEKQCHLGVGYRDGGQVLICRPPGAGPGYQDFTAPLWTLGLLRPLPERPARRESIVRALRLAVQWAETPRLGDYASGAAAYERWAADLNNPGLFQDRPAGELTGLCWCNGWCFGSLFNARQGAVEFLTNALPEFEAGPAECLQRAATAYRGVLAALNPGDPVPHPWDLFPQDFKRRKAPWDQASRSQQAACLVAAATQEQAASAALLEFLDRLPR